MNRLAHGCAVCSLLCSTALNAAPIAYTFSATDLTETRNGAIAADADKLFAPQETVSGSFLYDASVAASGAAPLVGTGYPAAMIGLAGSISGLVFADASGFGVVSNDGFDATPANPSDGLVDLLVLAAAPVLPPPTAGLGDQASNGGLLFDLVNVRIFWFESGTDFLSDENLPGSLPLGLAGITARLALDFRDSSGSGITHSVMSSNLIVTAVPLPPALALFLPGALIVALRARRR
jgi:hypothetical protein